MLSIVLCGCESWSLALREEHRLSVFENSVLRKILGANGQSNKWLENSAYGGASLFKLVATYCLGNQMKDELGGVCGTHRRKDKF
jgi:TRAP-type mannitol/chloroaromatic compound transport system permease small subunit